MNPLARNLTCSLTIPRYLSPLFAFSPFVWALPLDCKESCFLNMSGQKARKCPLLRSSLMLTMFGKTSNKQERKPAISYRSPFRRTRNNTAGRHLLSRRGRVKCPTKMERQQTREKKPEIAVNCSVSQETNTSEKREKPNGRWRAGS